MTKKRELADVLGDVALFSRCSSRQRRTIARHAQIATLPADVELVRQGEPGDALFVVLDGKAAVRQDNIVLREVGPGACFGELAVIDGDPRSATVVAQTDVTVAVIGTRMFRTLLREMPDLAEQLLIAMAAQLRAAWADNERLR